MVDSFRIISVDCLQLGLQHSDLAKSENVKFPASADTWLGNQNDPLGEFVLKRKLDLEVGDSSVP